MRAFHRLTREHAIPALPLLGADKIEFRDGSLYIEGSRVPLAGNGRFLVDYAHPDIYYDQMHPVSRLYKAIREGNPPSQPKDAVIIFLTQMTTGEAKHTTTPFGRVPMAFSQLAALNSALTGHWIARFSSGWLAVLLFGALLVAKARRKNWARLVFAACFLIGLLFAVLLLPVQFRHAPLFAWVSIVQNALSAVGVSFLFRHEATRWYRAAHGAAA